MATELRLRPPSERLPLEAKLLEELDTRTLLLLQNSPLDSIAASEAKGMVSTCPM